MMPTANTCAADPHAWQRAWVSRTSRPAGGAVSQLKPLARYARKDPMYPRSGAASVDCCVALAVSIVPDASPHNCCYRINPMPKSYITLFFGVLVVQDRGFEAVRDAS